MAFKNFYLILGIKNVASLDEIKAAYRELAKKFHP
ncbi:MAG: DnaJ domain-containing protein, partial [Bacteroidia bacterium]|nr:DnaJ domain-containing protein [Bacteroidia bacterium]